MWQNVLFMFLAGTVLALIDCMYTVPVTYHIFKLVVLGIFTCFVLLPSSLCANLAYGL